MHSHQRRVSNPNCFEASRTDVSISNSFYRHEKSGEWNSHAFENAIAPDSPFTIAVVALVFEPPDTIESLTPTIGAFLEGLEDAPLPQIGLCTLFIMRISCEFYKVHSSGHLSSGGHPETL